MRKILMILIAVMALVSCSKNDEDENVEKIVAEPVFEKQTYEFSGVEYPYQKAEIFCTESAKPKIVVYLHGGTSKGGDNEKQMSEPGIDSIFNYLKINHISSIFIIPQCPEKSSDGRMCDWVKMSSAVEFLIKNCTADNSGVYLFGGSMGGTGTWNMLSQYPGLFAAAMPCAGNPKGCNADNVAKTPVYAVMGGADKIMKPDDVKLQDFLDEVKNNGGVYRFDTEPSWDHEKTCTLSYSSERLKVVFSYDQKISDVCAADITTSF